MIYILNWSQSLAFQKYLKLSVFVFDFVSDIAMIADVVPFQTMTFLAQTDGRTKVFQEDQKMFMHFGKTPG